MESPCIGVCILEDDVCIGCGRSIAEIFQAGIDAERERRGRQAAEFRRSATEPGRDR
jgi:predicted Fe-S protein YdhL (DUF1289 family)